jgi:hypothetical protein
VSAWPSRRELEERQQQVQYPQMKRLANGVNELDALQSVSVLALLVEAQLLQAVLEALFRVPLRWDSQDARGRSNWPGVLGERHGRIRARRSVGVGSHQDGLQNNGSRRCRVLALVKRPRGKAEDGKQRRSWDGRG